MRAERPRRVAAGALLAIVAAAGCDAPTIAGEAPAYDPTALTSGRVYRWPLGASVAVYVAEVSGARALTPHVRTAADAWTATLPYREVAIRLVARAEDAEVVVGYAADHPVALDACGGFGIGAAFTLLCPAADSARTLPLRAGGPSRAKLAVAIHAAQIADDATLAAVVAHEVGHALGVGGHSADAGDLMHPVPRVARPSSRDAATLRYVTHRPVAIRLR